jgi:AcrR family transcriptional regulator
MSQNEDRNPQKNGSPSTAGPSRLAALGLTRSEDSLVGLSAKGLRTRERLLTGARTAFEKRGSYVETRISDIVEESGVAYGTFYTYFDSKEELFFELAVDVVHEMYVQGTSKYRGKDPLKRIESANREFMNSYRTHAAMMTIIEQAAAIFPELRGLRRRLRQGFVDRIAANLERWSRQGLIDRELSPSTAAHALVSMTDNFGYLWFVLGESFDEEQAIGTLTRLWVNALGLRPEASSGRVPSEAVG